jgi:hypothetical protein
MGSAAPAFVMARAGDHLQREREGMKILKFAAVAAVALTSLSAAPAMARHYDNDRHHGWHNRGHQVCHWYGHGRHRHRECHWVR